MPLSLSTDRLSELLGIRKPASLAANWPLIDAALNAYPDYTSMVAIAAMATVAIETAYTFEPVHERGSREYFIRHYWENERVRRALGNIQESDAFTYAGRGFIQLTGRANYAAGSRAAGMDLLADPDQAGQPEIAARLFADYFHSRKVYEAANAGDFEKVRRIVNGGSNGLEAFLALCIKTRRALNEADI